MKRRSAGFTLVEILIALLILMIGIVGVLAALPVGIRNTRDSVQDSTAANIAQSLHAAVGEAMRRAKTDTVRLQHDGTGGLYTLTLPAAVGVEAVHPSPTTVFSLADDPLTRQTVADVRTGDPSEGYSQYSWQLVVVRAEPGQDLFLVRFRIYRNFDPTWFGPPDEERPDLVKEFSAYVMKG